MIDLKELDYDIKSAAITDLPTRLAFTILAKHINAAIRVAIDRAIDDYDDDRIAREQRERGYY